MATIYVLLLVAVLVLVAYILYVTRPPSRKKDAESRPKAQSTPKPGSNVIQPSMPDELRPLDYFKSDGLGNSSAKRE
jgi:hypothetical protein